MRVRRAENQFCAKERILAVLCMECMMSIGRGFIEKSALEDLRVDPGRCECEATWRRIPYTAHDFGHSFILQVFTKCLVCL